MRLFPSPSTFSIEAYDSLADEWGVATESKFLAVGSVVPWARAGAGAVATQSYANTSFGPRGLQLMATGLGAQAALDKLLADDGEPEYRQVGLVDSHGNAATFTGNACLAWAGGWTGNGYAVQGNILVGAATLSAMADAFETSSGELADRLIAALAAGQKAGGDRRGQQSAALLVVKEKGGYSGFNDRYLDLRVDDAPRPIERLGQLLELHHLYFKRPDPAALIPIDARVARELCRITRQSGHYAGPITGNYGDTLRHALETLVGIENLEERWQAENRIDPVVFEFLQKAYPPPRPKVRRAKTAPGAKKAPRPKKRRLAKRR